MRLHILLYSAMLVALSNSAHAQLKWEARERELKPAVTDKESVATYAFSNPTDHTITIKNVTTSCGCTTVTLDKKVYAPGETGEINAVFTVGDKTGTLSKRIMVETDDPKESTVLLKMKVHIPEIIRISPRYLSWKQDSKAETKVIKLEVPGDQPVRVIKVVSSDESVVAELKTIQEGKEYHLTVRPASTKESKELKFEIFTDSPANAGRQIIAFAGILTEGQIDHVQSIKALASPADQPAPTSIP
jgi:hypothetical protein